MTRRDPIVAEVRKHREAFARELLNLGARRPLVADRRVAGGRGGVRFMWIDAAREQRFEAGVDAGQAEAALDQRVEAEAGQVTLVENDGVAERNRPRIVGLVRQHVEQGLRARPAVAVALNQAAAIGLDCCAHVMSPKAKTQTWGGWCRRVSLSPWKE